MNVKETVLGIIRDLCGKSEIKEEDTLTGDLGFDSLNMVLLLVSIEEVLDITLDESDMNPFDLITVADVCALSEKYRSN